MVEPTVHHVSTKVGKNFLSLLDVHLTKNHIYNSIFNRNKIKVSYSCMQNIKSIINNHNMKVLNSNAEIEESKNNYPLDGKCLTRTSFTKHRSCRTSPTIKKKFT